jgi:hypothetical protein
LILRSMGVLFGENRKSPLGDFSQLCDFLAH